MWHRAKDRAIAGHGSKPPDRGAHLGTSAAPLAQLSRTSPKAGIVRGSRESVPGTSRHWPPPPRSASTIRPFPGPARARRRPPKWLFASSRLLEMRAALFVCADASAPSLHRQSMPLFVCNTPRTTSRAASEAQCNVSILRRAQRTSPAKACRIWRKGWGIG